MKKWIILGMAFGIMGGLLGSIEVAGTKEKDLVAYWNFDEGEAEEVKDLSGNGNDGTINGDAEWVKQKKGYALKFNGEDAYVDCGSDDILNIADAITIECWVKRTGDGKGWDGIVSKGGGSSGYQLFYHQPSQNIVFYLNTDITGYGSITGKNIPVNEWMHVAATYDSNEKTIKLYQNGVMTASKLYEGQITNFADNFYIGRSTGFNYFCGFIDEVRIYNRALTEEEIKKHFEEQCTNLLGSQEIEKIKMRSPVFQKEAIGKMAKENIKSSLKEGKFYSLIVAPKQLEELANFIQKKIQEYTGVNLEIKLDSLVTEEDLKKSNIILLGNLDSGKLAQRLYHHYYIYCDAYFPGGNGYEIRTIYNPFGYGKNIVFIGASEKEGFNLAVDKFLSLLKPGKDFIIEPAIIVKSSLAGVPSLSKEQEKQYLEDAKKFREGDTFYRGWGMTRNCANIAIGFARNYYLSGDPRWANLAKERMLAHAVSIRDPKMEALFTFEMWVLLIAWDQIEECPVITDEEREEVVQYFIDYAKATVNCWKMSGPKHREKNNIYEIPHNHESFSSLGLYFVSEYLLKYYPFVNEAEYWMKLAQRCFRGQFKSFKPQEDSAGYQWLVPFHTMVYALNSGETEFFENGNAKKIAELGIMCTDNFGWEPRFGDCGHGFFSDVGLLRILRMASWYYNDGRLAWMAEKIEKKTSKHLHNYHSSLASSVIPEDFIGVKVCPLDKGVYEFFSTKFPDAKFNLPYENTFDKITFRNGFNPEDEYLLLDGFSSGGHKHLDGNSIIRFAKNKRVFLDEGDYILSAPKHHNTMIIIRDGEDELIPAVCGLGYLADFPLTGFAQTYLKDYNKVDWYRNIIWNKGEYFLFIDQVKANTPADYLFRTFWRTAGEIHLTNKRFIANQKGGTLSGLILVKEDKGASGNKVIEFDSHDSCLSFDIYLEKGNYEVSIFAYGTDGSHDSLWVDMDGKRLDAFHIPLSRIGPSGLEWGGRGGPLLLKLDNSKIYNFFITLREGPGVVMDRIEFINKETKNKIVVEAENMNFSSVKRESGELLNVVQAGDAQLNVKEEEGPGWGSYTYADPIWKILYQDKNIKLKKDEDYAFLNLLYATPETKGCTYTVSKIAPTVVRIRGEKETETYTSFAGICEKEFSSPVFSLEAKMFHLTKDIFSIVQGISLSIGKKLFESDYPLSLEIDLAKGKAKIINENNNEVKITFPLPLKQVLISPSSRIEEGKDGISLTLSKGTYELSFSLDSSILNEINSSLQKQKIVSEETVEEAKKERPTKNMKLLARAKADKSITSLCVYDLDGDGKKEIAVGSEDRNVYVFNEKAEKLWSYSTKGRINSIATDDLDNDGKAEVLIGSEDENLYVLDEKGNLKWKYQFSRWGGYKAGVKVVLVSDLDNDGEKEVICGLGNWHYFCLDSKGKLKWKKYVYAHPATTGFISDVNGDGKKELIAANQYYQCHLLDSRGEKIWTFGSPTPHFNLVCAYDLDNDGKEEVFVCTDNGTLNCLDSKGKLKWNISCGDRITSIIPLDVNKDGFKEIIVSSASNFVYILDKDGGKIFLKSFDAPINSSSLISPKEPKVGSLEEPKLVLGKGDGEVAIYSLKGEEIGTYPVPSGVNVINVEDLNKDGKEEIVAGCKDGGVYIFSQI
ncbi:hypothetical protein AUJ66_02290 [Candidatus Desantisbacteria bacterium CG1_02_38_46]|uniref:LamG-like jellyroll fold domain-containing protein n=2 Tax=unclassified Candidatus Desantisiibacteriota TaxID=3106372 RepID=A0A2H9P9G5_9BACT|nr:MAG: hypothetical protein AUJ66_02290 [Candidatus Desantisbacteria bacterium CG1_02_38_46]PIZ14893.1 MAG: hypothetical protein COY51_07040 [Candidatus Desantisbacteria bacterium CG_4_10_14_0_8_um_filter_39_17]